jgi:hypothetical protein
VKNNSVVERSSTEILREGVRMADKDERGRFLPGNRAAAGVARTTREHQRAIMETLKEEGSPENILYALQQLKGCAEKFDSWKAWEAYLTMLLNYQLGKPTIRVERVEGDPISAALEELRRIHAEKQTTYTVIEANTDNTENAR